MTKQDYKEIEFFLYNYHKINILIKERQLQIIESVNVSNKEWLKSLKQTSNTTEDQAIKLIDDNLIEEYKRWQVFIKKILVFLCKNSPYSYQYLVLKYFEKMDNEYIIKSLKIDFKALISLKNNLIEFIYKNAKLRDLI